MERLPPTFTAGQARAAGMSARTLYRRRDAGDLVELSRGVFRDADAPEPTYPDLLAVSLRAVRGVVCMVSAAAVHDLTDVIPHGVDLAVPNDTRPPSITYPLTTVYRFDARTHGLGVTTVEAAPNEFVPVYDAARTVVDLIRLRHRIGDEVAWTALNRYLLHPGARWAKLDEYARALRTGGPVLAALQVAVAR